MVTAAVDVMAATLAADAAADGVRKELMEEVEGVRLSNAQHVSADIMSIRERLDVLEDGTMDAEEDAGDSKTWEKLYDEDNEAYYYKSSAGDIQWERPLDYESEDE